MGGAAAYPLRGRRAAATMGAMSAAASVAATRDVLSYLGHYRGRLFVLRIEDDLLGAPLDRKSVV